MIRHCKTRTLLSRIGAVVSSLALLSACATAPAPRQTLAALNREAPRSILVVPALNNTVDVRAPDFFVSTISRPFADIGYYVFPAHMVKRLLDDDGLADAGLVHGTDARRFQKIFGCDAVLFVDIDRWDSRYLVLQTTTTVKFVYALKSCKTNETLWGYTQELAYTPQSSNSSGNALAGLVAKALVAAMEKGHPNFMPLTSMSNFKAAADLAVSGGRPPY